MKKLLILLLFVFLISCSKEQEMNNNVNPNIYYRLVEKNNEEAIYWYEKAANSGKKDSMCNLMIIYRDDYGDSEKAEYWKKRFKG